MQNDVNDEKKILVTIEENSQNSVRHLAETLGLSRHLVHRTLRQNGLHPYHFQRVQQLLPRDQEPRINFCDFLHNVGGMILFPTAYYGPTKERYAQRVFNSHNYLLWAEENPRAIRQHALQYRWMINIWAGIIANRIIGPYFLPPRLTGEVYTNFLEHQQQLIFQHDGALAHFSRQARNILNAYYPDKWMGRDGPIIWPARLPDLNVLDYFRRDGTEAEMREAILAAFNTITPEMAYRTTRNIIRRTKLCLQE
ncbi:hypothetical protein ACFW04_012579 [Cataglyphis niger]